METPVLPNNPSPQKPLNSIPPASPAPASSVSPALKSKNKKIRPRSLEPPPVSLGSDSVAYGKLPPGTKVGDRSVYIPGDENGNVNIHPGTAAGYGATADPSGIAIGAGAHAGGSPSIQQGGNGDCQANAIGGNATANCGAPEAVTGTYSYTAEGTLVTIRDGKTFELRDGEAESYKAIAQAYNSRNWKSLDSLTDAEIKRAPRWLTPYLFSALANVAFCHKDMATQRLNYFLEKAYIAPPTVLKLKSTTNAKFKDIANRLKEFINTTDLRNCSPVTSSALPE